MNKHFGTILKSTVIVAISCSTLYVGSRITNTNDNLRTPAPSIPAESYEYITEGELYAGISKTIHESIIVADNSNQTEKEKTKEYIVTSTTDHEPAKDTKRENKEKKIEPITQYTSTSVNLRTNPSIKSDIIKVLPRNTQVTKVAEFGDWSKIVYMVDKVNDGYEEYGYIHSNYLNNEKLTNRWNITLTPNEIALLEKIVWREAGNQSLIGQEAVAEVILNRMISEQFPDDLYSVLSQRGQFASWEVRNVGTPTESVKKAVQEVLDGNTNILDNSYLYFSRGGHASHNGAIRIEDHQFCPIG